mmetsp:Transcript_149287/g.362578  ORF Transcript_149287/g.362578 Transcript_149287/m.362578 type:complete len:230 (-) Transcript_149287:796-1485(-)
MGTTCTWVVAMGRCLQSYRLSAAGSKHGSAAKRLPRSSNRCRPMLPLPLPLLCRRARRMQRSPSTFRTSPCRPLFCLLLRSHGGVLGCRVCIGALSWVCGLGFGQGSRSATTASSHTGRSRPASWPRIRWPWLPACLCRTAQSGGQACIARTMKLASNILTLTPLWFLTVDSGLLTRHGRPHRGSMRRLGLQHGPTTSCLTLICGGCHTGLELTCSCCTLWAASSQPPT